MMSRRRISRTRATRGTGSAKLSTTWLRISARVGSTPQATTAKAGTIVTSRRTRIGTRTRRKPAMIICPAIVPTTELEMPEAIRETRKTPAANDPSSGDNVT